MYARRVAIEPSWVMCFGGFIRCLPAAPSCLAWLCYLSVLLVREGELSERAEDATRRGEMEMVDS